ncbi:MAG: hypothetical protein IJ247_05520 [Bacilli bacterium]|nr:hypothetical protein [Bacilli bacterium]
MKKKFLLMSGAAILSIGATAVMANAFVPDILKPTFINAELADSKLSLNSTNVPVEVTSSFQNHVEASVSTDLGNPVNLHYVLARSASDVHVELASRGMIYNYNNDGYKNGKITGIKKITASFSGVLYVETATSRDGDFFGDKVALTSGTPYVLGDERTFFRIIAGDGGASITNLDIDFSCIESDGISLDDLNGFYTGVGDDGYTYSLEITDGDATIRTLDQASPKTFEGTVALGGDSEVLCDFDMSGYDVHYHSIADSKVHKLTCDTITDDVGGAVASSVARIDFERVYNVEDFESYSATGAGYDKNNSQYTTTGLRSAYYADYYAGSGSSPIGGSSWNLMGSTDYLNFNSSKGHNGSKVGVFKGNNNSLRYIQMKGLYGTDDYVGKGTTLSFWARGAYSNSGLTTNSTADASLSVYAFSEKALTPSNQQTARTAATFTIPAGSDWTRYTMTLDSSKTYYSIGFFCKQSATTYLPIDDVQIYTADPYAEYEDPTPTEYAFGGDFVGNITAAGNSLLVNVGFGNNGEVAAKAAGSSMTPTGYTYDSSTNEFSITTTGSYSGLTYGTITGKFDSTNNKLYNVGLDGTISSYITDNGSIELSRPGYYYECEDDTSTMISIFKRRYCRTGVDGGWVVDTSNGDRVSQDKTNVLSGSSSLKLRALNVTGRVGLALNNDIAEKNYGNIGFWAYNPTESDVTIRLFIYKAASLGSNAEIGSVTAKAGGWSYCSCGFGSKFTVGTDTLYNFQLYIEPYMTAMSFDNLALF